MITTVSTPNLVTNKEGIENNSLTKESLEKKIHNLGPNIGKIKVKKNPFLNSNGGKIKIIK